MTRQTAERTIIWQTVGQTMTWQIAGQTMTWQTATAWALGPKQYPEVRGLLAGLSRDTSGIYLSSPMQALARFV